ncbi:MAG: membrane dipeptidase [Anaerolineales bacterium]|nr:MAG: membrane dipeptidase [Anaerolineales bacterium]
MHPILVDAHADIAYNMLRFERDYTRPAAETRRLEAGTQTVLDNEDTLLGWDDYQRGRVAVVFSTLFATPLRFRKSQNEKLVYKNFDEAHDLYREQLLAYHRMTDSTPHKFRLVASSSDLNLILNHWQTPGESGHPVGMVVLMEGAEGVRHPSELGEWYELGVRLIGPAWVGTRYCGGWREPGPLTGDGRELLAAMADTNFILDLSHMDERAAVEALDIYEGPIVATHANCAALLPNSNSNRHLSDRILEGIIGRDGAVGVVPFNTYLKVGWLSGKNPRTEVPLEYVANHIDHICQLAGDSLHAGIGTDFDGGFGVQSVPPEIDTIADLQNLVSLLQARGYSKTDIENIFSANWLSRLKKKLP